VPLNSEHFSASDVIYQRNMFMDFSKIGWLALTRHGEPLIHSITRFSKAHLQHQSEISRYATFRVCCRSRTKWM